MQAAHFKIPSFLLSLGLNIKVSSIIMAIATESLLDYNIVTELHEIKSKQTLDQALR